MKKSELKNLIREVLMEVKKDGLSGYKKAPDDLENTQMGATDKSVTSTTEPKEKEEKKKLPVVKKPAQPSMKDQISEMIKEEIEEYRIKGALGRGNVSRVEPLKAYVPKGVANMGRPKKEPGADMDTQDTAKPSSVVSVMVDGKNVGEFDLDLKTLQGKPDLQAGAMKKHVDMFAEKNDLNRFGFMSLPAYQAFDKLSDDWVDGALPDNAVIDFKVVRNARSGHSELVPSK